MQEESDSLVPIPAPVSAERAEDPFDAMSFVVLEKEIGDYADRGNGPEGSALEKRGFVAFFIGGLLALAVLQLPARWGVYFASVCVLVEAIGLAVILLTYVPRTWKAFRQSNLLFASQLEVDYQQWTRWVAWLGTFPKPFIARRLRYLHDRKASLMYRSGAVLGDVSRLGALPALGLLYVQLKDWEFGDWRALGHAHLLALVILGAMLVVYIVSWSVVRAKSRLDVYEALLAECVASSVPIDGVSKK